MTKKMCNLINVGKRPCTLVGLSNHGAVFDFIPYVFRLAVDSLTPFIDFLYIWGFGAI